MEKLVEERRTGKVPATSSEVVEEADPDYVQEREGEYEEEISEE